MRSTFSKKLEKRYNITNGSENMILRSPDFFSFGVCGFFGVGGSIRLVQLVCLLLARASQPSQKTKIFETKCVQTFFSSFSRFQREGWDIRRPKSKNLAPFLCIHAFWGPSACRGSIRLVKLVCLLLLWAPQPSQKANILKSVQNLLFCFVGRGRG